MKLKYSSMVWVLILFIACEAKQEKGLQHTDYPDLAIVGAMKNVMWKGKLAGVVSLDTFGNKDNLFGIGPVSFLRGEILVNDGRSFVSRVLNDSAMIVEETFDISAPFFVSGNVKEWKEEILPEKVKNIKDLEIFLDTMTKDYKRPLAYKLKGTIDSAVIHVQNLPDGTKVSSPDEAHQGQVNYNLGNEEVEIIGFYSAKHQGIFTHHDSHLHMHLITKDHKKMGHLDKIQIKKMILLLPKN